MTNTNNKEIQMPGENVTELHPDDAKALEERAELKKRRLEIFALAHQNGIPAFRDIEPNGGYDTNYQAGEMTAGVDIELNPDLEKIA